MGFTGISARIAAQGVDKYRNLLSSAYISLSKSRGVEWKLINQYSQSFGHLTKCKGDQSTFWPFEETQLSRATIKRIVCNKRTPVVWGSREWPFSQKNNHNSLGPIFNPKPSLESWESQLSFHEVYIPLANAPARLLRRIRYSMPKK